MSIPKRTPEEWLTAIRVGRPNKTVFTEGSTDARLLRAAMGFPERVDVRTADEVEYDPPYDPFVGSNKRRVLAVSQSFDALPEADPLKGIVLDFGRCLIDSDFNSIAAPDQIVTASGILVLTEYSNLLSCMVTKEWFRTCMSSAYAWEPPDEAWDLLKQALNFAFVSRFANVDGDLQCAAPDLGSYLTKVEQGVAFRDEAYVQAYFGWQGAQNGEFVASVYGKLAQAIDHRSLVNSNDLISAAYGLLKMHKNIGSKVQAGNVRDVILAMASGTINGDAGVQAIIDWGTA